MFSGKVLVAEDVEGSQMLMKLMLSKLGLKVTIAEDGKRAVEEALSQPFDLVLMDMHMPRMNGYDATRTLRQQGYKTPIVALTANAMKGDDRKCLDAGCDAYLTKPIDRRELPRILSKYLAPSQDGAGPSIESSPKLSQESEPACSEQDIHRILAGAPVHSDVASIASIINWEQLVERLGDEEIVREIMPTYIQDTQEHINQLAQAVEAGDCAAMASHAHALKGVGRNLGVDQLADIAYQMECLGRKNDNAACTLLFDGLSEEVNRVLGVLGKHDWSDRAIPIQTDPTPNP